MRRATITVDDIANELFPHSEDRVKGYLDILERLQRDLQDKGDDPGYARVIFAVDGQDKYVEITDRDIRLEGVFPRVSAVRYFFGQNNQGLRDGLSVNIRDTLVVVDNEEMAGLWGRELTQLNYSVRRI